MSGLLLSHVRGGADAGDLNTAHSHANGQGCPQIQESSIHIYRLGFSALDSPLPTLLMSHATGWLLVWSRMQMTLDRGVPPRVPTHAGTVTTTATKHQGTQLYLPQKLVSS